MKRILALVGAAFLATSSIAAYEAVELAPGKPVRVPCASKLAAVQVLAGTNAVTGASISLIRGTATNSVATGVAVTNGLVTATPASAAFALPGDGLLLSAGATNAVRATAILEH